MDYLEKLLADSTRMHAQWERVHAEAAGQQDATKDDVHNEHKARMDQYTVIQKRIAYIEGDCKESSSMHARWEQLHSEQAKLQKDEVEYVDKRLKDCNDMHDKSER